MTRRNDNNNDNDIDEDDITSLPLRLSLYQSRKCRSQSIDETLNADSSTTSTTSNTTGAPTSSTTITSTSTSTSMLTSSSTTNGPTLKKRTQAETNLLTKSAPFHKFVLTGGPCGGKTTALARLSSFLRERGFEVITVPEAFTILASNGFQPSYFAVDGMPFCVQHSVMDMQMALEDSFERILRAKGAPGVLLCDRGIMDGAAYMTQEEWDGFLKGRNICEAAIREGRYNAVFHLVTAAEGASKYYTLENNDVRTETVEEARVLDVKTRGAWVGHPKLFVIDNKTDFEGKLNALVGIASDLVGLPSTSKQVTVKYLLRNEPNVEQFPKEMQYHLFQVEKVYLYDTETTVAGGTGTGTGTGTGAETISSNPDSQQQQTQKRKPFENEYSFIRKRTHLSHDGQLLGTTYGLTTVHITHGGKHIEVKRIITPREYMAAYKNRDVARHIVKQMRMSFIWDMQSFNVHIYKEPVGVEGLCIVHVQQSVRADAGDADADADGSDGIDTEKVNLPSFLDIERQLNDGKGDSEKFGAFSISLCDQTVLLDD